MRVKELALTLLLPLVAPSGGAAPAACESGAVANSGAASATIVELYTSEGCDSCPPVDAWFATLRYPRDGVVPLAFHVDYWDYIGWKDRFAKPAYAQRQRDAVTRQGSRTTYTPQLMLDGRDLRAGSYPSRFQSRVREVAARAPRAGLALDVKNSRDRIEVTLNATFVLPAERADAAVFIAVTEDNLASRVTAGENKGALLRHDHVVRELIGPLGVDSADWGKGNFTVKRNVALAPDWKRGDLSLVAFLQNPRTGEILQALSTPLCRG